MPEGELAIVLHTHMPYVEGFGTWPFGEELLWEAVASCYLPLLEVLDRHPSPPLTLSLTPVLCDQLEHPGALDRCLAFLREIRPETHRRDAATLRAAGEERLAAELDRSAAEYTVAADQLAALQAPGARGLLGALGEHARWTSSATHAILPLIATERGLALQLQTGIASHRRRFGAWAGGLWLPECAHVDWLGPALEAAGVRAACVELTARLGRGAAAHLQPLTDDAGPVLWPIDRLTIDRVWGQGGYPSGAAYRDYHRYTDHRHRVWRIDGGGYDHAAALAQVRLDAAAFVTAVSERIADGGVCVCALDTELLGHWWYEGIAWLDAVLAEAAARGLALTTLDDALGRHPPVAPPRAARGAHATSWGEGEDLRTWSGPGVGAFAWPARRAELGLAARATRPPDRALRELLALQASDWAFLHHRDLAGPYPTERIAGHAAALDAALADPVGSEPALRGLAPDLSGW